MNTTAAARALRAAAAVAFWLVLALGSACAEPAPAAGGGHAATPADLERAHAENVRLARRVAELEVAAAELRRARRTPLDQPVVRSWIARADDRDDGDAATFELCVQYFAHGDFLDLLPNTLGTECRRFTLVEATAPADALRALVTSADFACWSRAATDRPLPACWR